MPHQFGISPVPNTAVSTQSVKRLAHAKYCWHGPVKYRSCAHAKYHTRAHVKSHTPALLYVPAHIVPAIVSCSMTGYYNACRSECSSVSGSFGQGTVGIVYHDDVVVVGFDAMLWVDVFFSFLCYVVVCGFVIYCVLCIGLGNKLDTLRSIC